MARSYAKTVRLMDRLEDLEAIRGSLPKKLRMRLARARDRFEHELRVEREWWSDIGIRSLPRPVDFA